ncbi:MAG: ATP-dependent RecD-like DNA helicase [Lachnospiraceae bacterium]|nr:ATP-dependent RecD-like DNA helicase [Lachnospiraceae bacterium]
MEHLRCVVERITYQNEQNGYSVIKCRAKGFQDLVTVVGSMPDVHVGSVLSLGGSWRMDARYGRQFSMETFEETLPATVYGIEKYLGSGLIRGIGPKYAKLIVGRFGKDTLEIIEETPDELLKVPGIGKSRVESIKKGWTEQKEIKNIMLFLQSHDVSTSHATKIYKTYGNESIRVVKENPYRLADDIWGIGFRTADTIAEKMGFGHEKYARLRSGILYTLNKLADDGHCYATRDMLLNAGTELLSVEDNLLSMTLDEMIRQKDVIIEELLFDADMDREPGIAIYLPPFFHSERGVAKRLKSILKNSSGIRISPKGLAERVSRKTGMSYDTVQMRAIESAVQSKIMILTGGPGTGKTTTTLGIITAFRESGADILLAAPTGRAAKRLSEATGMEAKTIHRLLETKPPEGYQRNEENPLEGDVLIIDECSMIDIMLMYNLLKAVPDSMTLILVGDIDQLPSVGAGNVLRDLIDSDCFLVVRLTKIFRQAQSSRIITNAHRINAGKMPDISGGRNSDFFFMEEEDPDKAKETIVSLVKKKLPDYYHTASSDIQVLTPMQRSVIGASNLNQALQDALNPSGAYLRRGGICYRMNDKVMQIRNNYDKDVFNGDIGIISSVDTDDRSLTVRFDDRQVDYDVSELDELVLAYASTIHKAQGSEYPIVIIPVMMNHYVMLQRNLIYTGITRAKKILVLVGTKKALAYCVNHMVVDKRNTLLKDRLKGLLPKWEEAKVTDLRGGEAKGQIYDLADRKTENLLVAEAPEYGKNTEDGKISHEEWLKIDLFDRLSKSEFRSRFKLAEKDREYIADKGMDTIRRHAGDLIDKRLAPGVIENDGRQTPMKGHPVFIAQHATGTCCRSCLEKWHGIDPGRELSNAEREYVVDVIMKWIDLNRG